MDTSVQSLSLQIKGDLSEQFTRIFMKKIGMLILLLPLVLLLSSHLKDEPFPPDEEDIPCFSNAGIGA
ncbi:hypothetical protein Lqui_2808 [Legionella quinlivanii]|uniref:Uncharacterized protein n=1 Tax=Legionella quinlivanii TaxID=45073 RepID=A0A0W0XKX6_9GAMM|nr:hypothetical protein [Legionella quinlivanii]KTD45337.1 hypothetical protein Lqui_2808 [Legionella quinlivanii]MCW8451390.1 hypothetical protein [Legionella quinlivanii]SEG15678.1 hypothetical protein SAMN02746093_02025 [Legionella quinlivanii DSM 21216]STY10407.1 Uncharacterised protein [Legionella quinlivanii]